MKPWTYTPFETLGYSFLERLQNIPHERDLFQMGVRKPIFWLIRRLMKRYFDLKIEGLENLPKEGSYAFVSNHSSHLDIFCLLASLPSRAIKHVHIAAAADYFFTNKLRSICFSLLINAFPIDRKGCCVRGLQHCKKILARGSEILILFPEGGRSHNGTIRPFKAGIGHLIQQSGVIVVPVGLQGCWEAWPRHKRLPRLHPIKMVIGTPLHFDGQTFDKQQITQTIQYEVEKCLKS